MKKLLSWLLGLPVLAGAVTFALANRGAVTLSFWPSSFTLGGPIYAVVFACVLIGVFLGGTAAWLAYGRKRALSRERAREIKRLEEEIEDLKRRIGDAEAEAKTESPAAKDEAARRQLVAAEN
jgi:uncharacterized membrane protein YciS (DUF1049 family)